MKTAHESQPMLSIGALLASEREKRGIPVEKAAKETRMRPQRIRDMECDDLSNFTNPSYARMFIIAYAKYLAIPMKTISEHLPDRGEPCTENYQYITTPTHDLPALRQNIAGKPTRHSPSLYGLIIAAVLLVTAVVAGGITYLTVVVAPRLAKDEARKEVVEEAPKVVFASYPIERYTSSLVNEDGTPATDFEQHTLAVSPISSSPARPFENSAEMAAPPTPQPEIVDVKKPAPPLTVTTAPAPAEEVPVESVIPDDRSYVLGPTPEVKPANAQ